MSDKREGKMIHVRLPVDIHKRLRIRVAEEDTNIQKWVADLVIKELERIKKNEWSETP